LWLIAWVGRVISLGISRVAIVAILEIRSDLVLFGRMRVPPQVLVFRVEARYCLEESIMAKRGRPSDVTSWWRNPNNIAAHHARGLMELWLAGAPVLEIRVMLSSLAGSPEYQVLIDECWSKLENERRFTVPLKIKRKLCRLAVAHVMELHRDAIQRVRARAAERALGIQGFSRAAASEILRRTTVKQVSIEAPNLEKVMEIVNRRAPPGTLRRKAADRKLRK
jgi:hypothetical protein